MRRMKLECEMNDVMDVMCMYIAAAKGSSHTCDQKGEKVSPLILLTWRCLTGRVVLLCPMSCVCRPISYISYIML